MLFLLFNSLVFDNQKQKKFVNQIFHDDEVSTINANFLHKDMDVQGVPIRLNIWDTAGQERFRALASNYYKQATGAVLVYDITDKSSIDRVKHWVKELQMQAGQTIKIVIAGNKCDREQERNISREEAQEYARSIGATHISTSAKTGKGVDELYNTIAKLVVVQDTTDREQNEKKTGLVEAPPGQRTSPCKHLTWSKRKSVANLSALILKAVYTKELYQS